MTSISPNAIAITLIFPNAAAMTLHSTLYYMAPNSVVQDRLILNQSPDPEPIKTKCLCP